MTESKAFLGSVYITETNIDLSAMFDSSLNKNRLDLTMSTYIFYIIFWNYVGFGLIFDAY